MYQIRLYPYGKVIKRERFETLEALRKKYILYQQRDNIYAECVIDGKALKQGRHTDCCVYVCRLSLKHCICSQMPGERRIQHEKRKRRNQKGVRGKNPAHQ